jgi:hypothetical protein
MGPTASRARRSRRPTTQVYAGGYRRRPGAVASRITRDAPSVPRKDIRRVTPPTATHGGRPPSTGDATTLPLAHPGPDPLNTKSVNTPAPG